LCCSVLQCVAVCCSALQCVAVYCSVLQCAAVYCSVLQCVAVCCSVLQCAAVCCSVSTVTAYGSLRIWATMLRLASKSKSPWPFSRSTFWIALSTLCCSVLQCVAVCCSVLQCVAVRCSVLQRVAVSHILHCVCCILIQYVAVKHSVLQWNTLQLTASPCNTLQHATTHCMCDATKSCVIFVKCEESIICVHVCIYTPHLSPSNTHSTYMYSYTSFVS